MIEVLFLGTAGARYVVAKQLRASGGLVLLLDNEITLLDPGPGTLVYLSKHKISLNKIKNLILTHKHLDHSADLNILVDALTEGGLKKKGRLFLPEEAIKEGILLPYLKDSLLEVQILREHQEYMTGNLKFRTSCRLIHNAENYGLIFYLPSKKKLGLISDTAYFEELKREFEGCDFLIMNLVRYEAKEGVLHLSFKDAKDLLATLKPKLTIITHFGMTMLQANPFFVARNLSEELSLRVIAAFDGLRITLS